MTNLLIQIFYSIAADKLGRFSNDKEIFAEAMKLLQANKNDPDVILCAESLPIGADNVEALSERQLDEVFEDFYQFSCSFVDKGARELTKDPMAHCAVDFSAMQKFYKRVRDDIAARETDPEQAQNILIDKLLVFLDISENVTDRKNDYGPEYHMVAVRGFTMLLMMQEMEIFNFYGVFERMIELFSRSTHSLRKQPLTEYQNFPVEFVARCLSKDELGAIIQKF